MTCCVGLFLRQGPVMLADTRSNAGADRIATHSKVLSVAVPGERALCLLSSGNLTVTQDRGNQVRQAGA